MQYVSCELQEFYCILKKKRRKVSNETSDYKETVGKTCRYVLRKPDFHSHLSPVASVIFVLNMRKLVKSVESDEKISFALFTFEVQIFQLLRKFLASKPIRFLA